MSFNKGFLYLKNFIEAFVVINKKKIHIYNVIFTSSSILLGMLTSNFIYVISLSLFNEKNRLIIKFMILCRVKCRQNYQSVGE